LFGAGAGAALAAGALVTALTLSVAQSGARDVLWVLTGAGAVVLVLCLIGYLTQRRDRGREISELKKDL
jgi:FtsH-binding integral membrane protein